MHTSVMLETPIEIIDIVPFNPLISKCQIKVCYVSDEPNRNGSIITKDVARQIANSLPGSPIVGYYNENEEDFEEHNRIIEISNGEFKIKDTTKPYGFVDLNAKVWFAKYLDDDEVEHEYLVTEGWLWTEQYPECKRVIEEGNNQSMELDEESVKGFWAEDINRKSKFFIINEAIISKLCILGEDYEPCFEGASVEAPTIQFSFDDNFKETLFSMMKELTELLNEGGAEVFTRYAVEIGDRLWCTIFDYLGKTYPDNSADYPRSIYYIEGIYEEKGTKFVILQNRNGSSKLYRLNFSFNDNDELEVSDTLIEVTKNFVPSETPQFPIEEVEEYARKKFEAESNQEETNNFEKIVEDKTEFSKSEEEKEEVQVEEDSFKFAELETKYSELETKYNALIAEKKELETQIASLTEFKVQIERKEKETMIESFYMLSDEDKADVVANIDKYSLDDIEAKLSIICVRNKVNFNLEDDNKNLETPTVFNLNNGEDDSMPGWVKRAMSVAKNLK